MQTVIQFLVNQISNYLIDVPIFLSRLSVFGWAAQLNTVDLNSDISAIDPFLIDNFRYNPADERWYESPPQPDYGQYGWMNPADANTQTKLTFLRDLRIAWQSGAYDEFFKKHPVSGMEKVNPNTNTQFSAARTYVPPRGDPLALDLDRDGIETIGANGTVLFDHDGDGVKTGTGWVAADDGLLVLDRNGNGQIDTGAELFGVDTVLANGQKASDGFAALRDLDANADSVFDAADAQFGNVRVWRDLNQNGTSQAGELFTLNQLGIAAINLNATAETVDLGNGNVQTATASYVLTNGTTGETTGVGLGETAANLELALNPFYRQFTDAITLTEQARLLPEMQGSGRVRDLREALNDPVFEIRGVG